MKENSYTLKLIIDQKKLNYVPHQPFEKCYYPGFSLKFFNKDNDRYFWIKLSNNLNPKHRIPTGLLCGSKKVGQGLKKVLININQETNLNHRFTYQWAVPLNEEKNQKSNRMVINMS